MITWETNALESTIIVHLPFVSNVTVLAYSTPTTDCDDVKLLQALLY